jgi:tight adherence protein B
LSPAAQERVEAELQRAGVPLRAGEYLAIRLASALAGALMGLLLASRLVPAFPIPFVAAAVLFVGGWLAPRVYLSMKRARRLDAIERQVPDALDTLARSLRAGTGVVQALIYTADETPPPLGPELALTMRELRLGANPEEAFAELSNRVGSADLDIAVTAIVIQRTVGGNLSEILTGVSHTIRERAKLYGEVKVLTSRQKLTGNLVALIPVLIGLAFIGLNPEVGGLLVNTMAGRISLAIGFVFELLGFVLIRKLAQIEV